MDRYREINREKIGKLENRQGIKKENKQENKQGNKKGK